MAEINNLPIKDHERYAADQDAMAHAPHIKEGPFIVGLAQVDVTAAPSYPSAVTSLIGQDRTNVPWALIEPPAIMGARRTDLFKGASDPPSWK